MNGYISLKIGGKVRGIKFGNRALLDLIAKHQLQEGVKFSFDLMVDLVYFGLLNNCRIKKEDPDFTADDVAEWVDNSEELPLPKLMEIFEVFQKSFSLEGPTQKGKTKKLPAGK